jgi:hypothetical protein
MKWLTGILLLIVITFVHPTLAQDFEGVYKGDLFSKNNLITLRVKKGAASGVLFTSASDKHVFQGMIKGRELAGTLNYASKIWTLGGMLKGDSLSMTMASGLETKQALLLRISSNPKADIPDIIESFSRDERLIGKWLLVKSVNLDGSPKKIDSRFSGMIRTYESNGTFYAEFPSTEALYKSLPSYSPPQSKWSTQNSKITMITNVANTSKTGSSNYEIRNDTLTIVTTIGKDFYLRKK